MSTSPMVQFTPESVASFKAAVAETVANTRRTLPQVVLWASQFFCVSARKHTPRCRARKLLREVVTTPRAWSGLPRYRIKIYSQYRPQYWLSTQDINDQRRQIRYAGTARNSWNGVYQRLGKRFQAEQSGKGESLGDAQKRLTGDTPEIEITNRVMYLQRIAPTLLNDTLVRTTHSMERQLSRAAVKQFRKGWRVSA